MSEVNRCSRRFSCLDVCYGEEGGILRLTQSFFRLWQELTTNDLENFISSSDTTAIKSDIPREGGSIASTVAKHNESRNSSLNAIWDSDRCKPVFSRDEKVKLLDSHWEQVFGPKQCSIPDFEKIVTSYSKSFPGYKWELDRKYLDKLVRSPKKSYPGPDGIPFLAFSIVPHISVDVLWDCAQHILHGGSPPPNFNYALLSPLPKKPSVDADGTKWFAAKDTRPISIVNADNRIIANLFRNVLASFANRICGKEQRFFLLHRYLLENVIEIDFEARKMYIQGGKGAMLLIDLTAAFPSLSHDYFSTF